MPTTTSMEGVSEKPYASYWPSAPTAEASFSAEVRNQYKMSWNKSITNANIKCVSELLNTNNWIKFVNTTYAEDAVGTPTLEMWVDSWNEKGVGEKLYYNNSNEYGYFVGNTNLPETVTCYIGNSNDLYFPIDYDIFYVGSYWLASPSALWADYWTMCWLMLNGYVSAQYNYYGPVSLRPVVRLKSTVSGTLEDGIWTLKI